MVMGICVCMWVYKIKKIKGKESARGGGLFLKNCIAPAKTLSHLKTYIFVVQKV